MITQTTRKYLINREILHRASKPTTTQLDRLNRSWIQTSSEVPLYRSLVLDGSLPIQFESLEHFAATVPVSNKDQIRADINQHVSDRSRPNWWRVSSGTTGTPLPLPAWATEKVTARTDQWIARSWIGLDPGMSLELVWGHLHRMGPGLRPRVARAVRALQDYLLSYRRHSAYLLSDENISNIWSSLRTSKADFAIALPSFVEAAARYLQPHELYLGKSRLKVLILTGESLLCEREGLGKLLGIPIRLEYGATECGVIAQEVIPYSYRVLTDTFLLEGVSDKSGQFIATITTLYPRCTPLVRYQLGDIIEEPTLSCGISIQTFARLQGRVRPAILSPSGFQIHAAAINHAVEKAGITERFQVVLDSNERIQEILLMAPENSPNDRLYPLVDTLRQAHPDLEHVKVRMTSFLHQTAAGKTPVYIKPS